MLGCGHWMGVNTFVFFSQFAICKHVKVFQCKFINYYNLALTVSVFSYDYLDIIICCFSVPSMTYRSHHSLNGIRVKVRETGLETVVATLIFYLRLLDGFQVTDCVD